jgi:hypothetical protein
MNRQIIEIISWRIISEFMRRYAGKFTVIETHPCSGQYDCLSIYDYSQRHILDLNRGGSLHIWSKVNENKKANGGPIDSYPDIWKDFVFEPNPKEILDLICRKAGLNCNITLPPSTPEILSYRFISGFMNQTVFGMDQWECRNGYYDSSGYGTGIINDFDLFPPAKERLRVSEQRDILNIPAYRFWFIQKKGKSKLCLETNGTVWNKKGKAHDLFHLYQKNRRISGVVYEVAKDLLP